MGIVEKGLVIAPAVIARDEADCSQRVYRVDGSRDDPQDKDQANGQYDILDPQDLSLLERIFNSPRHGGDAVWRYWYVTFKK